MQHSQRLAVFLCRALCTRKRHFRFTTQDSRRRAQLVRGVGHESPLPLKRLIHALQQLVERCRQPAEFVPRVLDRQALVQILRTDPSCLITHRYHWRKSLPGQEISANACEEYRNRNHPSERRAYLFQHFLLWMKRLQNDQRIGLALQRKFSNKRAISAPASFYIFKQAVRGGRIREQFLKWRGRKETRRRGLVWQILRRGQHSAVWLEHRENVIAIVMLDNRLLRRQTRSVRAVVVQDLGSHCAEKGFRELRQTGVGPLQRAAPKNKIGDK